MNDMTEEEYLWMQENVDFYKSVNIEGLDYVMVVLKNGDISLAETLTEAVRQEIEQTGIVKQIELGENQ